MVNMNHGTSALTLDTRNTVSVDSTTYPADTTYYIGASYYYKSKQKKETKKQKRDRISLERNKKSWVTFNERMPNIKQVIKPRTLTR